MAQDPTGPVPSHVIAPLKKKHKKKHCNATKMYFGLLRVLNVSLLQDEGLNPVLSTTVI